MILFGLMLIIDVDDYMKCCQKYQIGQTQSCVEMSPWKILSVHFPLHKKVEKTDFIILFKKNLEGTKDPTVKN